MNKTGFEIQGHLQPLQVPQNKRGCKSIPCKAYKVTLVALCECWKHVCDISHFWKLVWLRLSRFSYRKGKHSDTQMQVKEPLVIPTTVASHSLRSAQWSSEFSLPILLSSFCNSYRYSGPSLAEPLPGVPEEHARQTNPLLIVSQQQQPQPIMRPRLGEGTEWGSNGLSE